MSRTMELFTGILACLLVLAGITGCDSSKLATPPDAATPTSSNDQLLPLVNGEGPPDLEPPAEIKARADSILHGLTTISPRGRTVTPFQIVSGISSGNILYQAYSWLGVPYCWGGNSRSCIDCSHLVYQVYRSAGISSYPYMTTSQMRSSSLLAPRNFSDNGDGGMIVLFRYLGHCGIYIGNGWMVDANSFSGKVKYDYLWSSYWSSMGPYLVEYRR